MDYAMFLKVSNEMLIHDEELVNKYVKYRIKDEKKRVLKKSIKLMYFSVKISYCNGDDFIKNLTTIRIDCQRYKIPRIIKKISLCQPKSVHR